MNAREIIEKAKQDANSNPNLEKEVDTWIEEIKNSASELPHYLDGKTFNILSNEIKDVLLENGFLSNINPIIEKLDGYRYVDEINELFRGKFIRWIRIETKTPKLTNGAMVMEIKFLDDGIQVLCRNGANRFIQFKWDDCVVFQKLTDEEWMLLSVKSQI
jgi:hypothetical protein